MANVGTLAVYLTGNASRFNKTMMGAQRTLSNFGRAASGIGGMIAGALGGVGVGLALKSSLEAYNAQESALTKLNAVLQATGGAAGFTVGELHKFAGELQKSTTYGDDATESVMAVLATFKDIKGDVFKDATRSILDMSEVLGTDAKAGAIQLGKALNDPIRGVTALTRVGVSFTQEQKNQIENFQKQGDLVAAQQIILTELASEFGGAAEAAAKTTAGKIKQMSNAFGDVKEQIGFILVEGFKLPELMETVREKIAQVQAAFESGQVMKWFIETKFIFMKIGAVLAVFGENIATQILWIGENWGKLWKNALAIGTGFLTDFANVFINGITTIVKTYMALFSNSWGFVRDGFLALWDYIRSGGTDSDAFSGLLENAKARMADIGQTAVDGLAKTVGDIGRETEKAMAAAGVTKLELQGLDEILSKFAELDAQKAREIAAIAPAFADLLGQAVKKAPPVPVKTELTGPVKFAAAVEKGTLEAYKAEIGRSTVEENILKVNREQLAVEREQLTISKRGAGDFELAEIGV